MKISGRLALAMVLLVVVTSCIVSAFAYYFLAEAAPRAVLTSIISAALAGGGIAAVLAIALAVGITNVLLKPPPRRREAGDCRRGGGAGAGLSGARRSRENGAGDRRKRARCLCPDRWVLRHSRLEPARRGLDGVDARRGRRQERGRTSLSGTAARLVPAMARPVSERGRRRRGRRAIRNAAAAKGRPRILRRGFVHRAAPQ